MHNWDLRRFRNDLSIFIGLINDSNIKGDFSNLEEILLKLDDSDNSSYKLQNICFFINSGVKGTLPNNLTNYQLFLENEIMLKYDLQEDNDPIYRFKFDLNINAYMNSKQDGTCYRSNWHLDQHYSTDVTKNTHPTYHFHFGGKKIDRNIQTGELAILKAPRIPHPPMDIFLGFHFILSNFYNTKIEPIKSLIENYEYQEIIKRAQKRLWTPYFGAFVSTNNHNDFTVSNIFPLFMN